MVLYETAVAVGVKKGPFSFFVRGIAKYGFYLAMSITKKALRNTRLSKLIMLLECYFF
uniref:hypothetical protein n=1 Tax=Listeria ivanovii TaxID=1638 RepID=UPI0018ECD29C|nr:hypothetical protein [Listeria ivanovii]